MTHKQLPEHSSSYWLDSTDAKQYPKLDQSIETDVVIVGGGIVGITAAYFLSEKKIDTVLIEGDRLFNGTTGHTTAKITAQHGLIYDELISNIGEDQTKQYYKANEQAIHLIRSLIEKHQIDCELKEEDAYLYTNDDTYIEKLKNEYEAYQKLGIPGSYLTEMPLQLPMKAAIKMPNQAQFHPLKYLKTLVQESEKSGCRIYEETTAVDIEETEEDHAVVVTRDEHRISCKKVIIATHFPFWDKRGILFARMYPKRSYVVAAASSLSYPGGMYITAESPTRSIREVQIDGKDYLLVGGDSHKVGQGDQMIEHYEALRDFAVSELHAQEITYRWSAQDPITLDKVPYIGPIIENHPNIFIGTGFGKWGMTQGTIAARHITDLIIENGSPYEKLYDPSRFEANPDLKEFASVNADVAKHMVKGKLDMRKGDTDQLEADQALVTRIGGQRTGIYKDKQNQLHAVDTTCTHLGCEVNWNSAERSWDCPCHGSRFSYTGDVLEGPAKEPLKKVDLENE